MENVTDEIEKSTPEQVLVTGGVSKNRRNYGPGGRFGHRRSPNTGHRRRHLTPDPKRGESGESDVIAAETQRSQSTPRDVRVPRPESSSDEDNRTTSVKSKKKSLSAVELKRKAKKPIESETSGESTQLTTESVLRRRQRSKSKEARDEERPAEETEPWWKLWPKAKSVEPEGKPPSRPKRTRSASRGKSDPESTDDQEKPLLPSRSRPRSRPNSELYKDESSDDFWKPKGSMEKLHSNFVEKKKEKVKEKENVKSVKETQEKEKVLNEKLLREKLSREKEKIEKEKMEKEKLEKEMSAKKPEIKDEKKSIILETRKLGLPTKPKKAEKVEVTEDERNLLIKRNINWKFLSRDSRKEWRQFVADNAGEVRKLELLKRKCISDLLLMVIFCGIGAVIFRSIEGAFEVFYKCGVKRVKRDFIDNLWLRSHNLPEDEWKSLARRKLMAFEDELHTAFEAGLSTYSGQRSWSFINAFIYCLTVITTIGYGHITPSTTTGKAITIVYAVFGIPMFLILLADFGKMFTRCIKFLWAFVRRLYYTGSCKKVRRNVPQEVMKGVQIVYSMTKLRRPSAVNVDGTETQNGGQQEAQKAAFLQSRVDNESPGTPNLSAFAIDDEFNLPISVAIVILLLYIICGASVFYYWEDWGFFESFYFVFISMSTIGFGDYVPQNQMYMMASIVYLVFGLALTSMCINVVQEKLSDSIRRASAKIGATIGFQEDELLKPNFVETVAEESQIQSD